MGYNMDTGYLILERYGCRKYDYHNDEIVSGMYSNVITRRSPDGKFRVKINGHTTIIKDSYINKMKEKRLNDLKYVELHKNKLDHEKFKKAVLRGITFHNLARMFGVNKNKCRHLVEDMGLSKLILS